MLINSQSMMLTSYHHYNKNHLLAMKSMERLSTGQRINRASDDAAGLSISEKMQSQIRGLSQAQRNVQDAKSLLDVADGAAGQASNILLRLKELSVKGSNETLSDDEYKAISVEVNELIDQFHDTTHNTTFNGKGIFDSMGNYSIAVDEKGNAVQINFGYLGTDGLGGNDTEGVYRTMDDFRSGGVSEIKSSKEAKDFLSVVDNVSKLVLTERTKIGAKSNRLDYTMNNINSQIKNITSAESRIRDVDVAKETMELTKRQMLSEVAMSMMAQGMQHQQSVLRLLQ